MYVTLKESVNLKTNVSERLQELKHSTGNLKSFYESSGDIYCDKLIEGLLERIKMSLHFNQTKNSDFRSALPLCFLVKIIDE